MSNVFVVDTNKQALNPVHPGRARLLLTEGKASVFRRYPFTIILKTAIESPTIEPLRIKIDPGSKTTGIAIVNDTTGDVVFAAELSHRGQDIVHKLESRASLRRGRRSHNTRYRKPRWRFRKASNREGLKAPSMISRVSNTETWVRRLMRSCPISAISMERVKFDMQQMENPDISGIEYQQGTLAGYNVQEFLLEKWERKCAYCEKPFSNEVKFTVDHIHPKSKGGSDRPSNLVASCEVCNQKKNNCDIKDFLATKPELLKKIMAHVKAPLKDAAAVNSTRKYLLERLQSLGVPVECGTGALTKLNRKIRDIPKSHWTDAVCVGESTPSVVKIHAVKPLLIKAIGSGSRDLCRTDAYGFPARVGKDMREEVKDGRLSGKRKHTKKSIGGVTKRQWRWKAQGGKWVKRPKRRVGEDTRETVKPRGYDEKTGKSRKKSFGYQTGDFIEITGGKYKGQSGRMSINSVDTGSLYLGAGKNRKGFNYKICRAVQRCDGYDYSIG